MRSLASCSWPLDHAGAALSALGRAAKLTTDDAAVGSVPAFARGDDDALVRWMDAAARAAHLEVAPLRPRYAVLEEAVSACVLLLVPGEPRTLLAIVDVSGGRAKVLAPDGETRRFPLRDVCALLRAGFDRDAEQAVDALLDRAALPAPRRARARDTLLTSQLGKALLEAGWTVTAPPSAPFARQALRARLPQRALLAIALEIAMQTLSILAWWLVGKGALGGHLEPGWLIAWALLLATLVPIRIFASWLRGATTLDFTLLLKTRLLAGTLALDPEVSRREGSGRLLGRVMDAEALETLVTSGAMTSLFAIVELVVALIVLGESLGARGVVGFAATVLFGAILSWRYLRRLRVWTTQRLGMTHDLVERLVGHRTRLVQEPREAWREADDGPLARYVAAVGDLDRIAVVLSALPRAWLLVGLILLAPLFAGGASGGLMAMGIGGVLLASSALGKLSGGAATLFAAESAWSEARSLFRTGGVATRPGRASLVVSRAERGGVLLEARDLSFRYPERSTPVLRGASLRIERGDRVLLEGASGGGKSTLGSILTGLRRPDAGLLLLGGLDPHTLGAAEWRHRVVASPQFHENHVMSATLAFNLLMGRRWPPRPSDLAEATAVCEELGLGDLLARMPNGLMQMVGETGWQLSHGERSRVFVARALLQNADLMVLDESFATLDPETMARSLKCVLSRAETMLVVAHP